MTSPAVFPKAVLADQPLFRRSFPVQTFGRNIVSVIGDEHKRHKNVSSPAFARPLNPEPFARSVQDLIGRWNEEIGDRAGGRTIEVYGWMQRLTLDVLGKNIFSFDFKSLDAGPPSKWVTLYNDMIKNVLNPISIMVPFWSLIPTAHNLKTKRDLTAFRALLGEMVTSRLALLDEAKAGRKPSPSSDSKSTDQKTTQRSMDLLDMMVSSAYDSSDPMHHLSKEELINDLGVFFVAGHDTTSNALSVALHHLALNPTIQRKARDHVRTVLSAHDGQLTKEAVSELDYVTAIIKESLRLYPSAAILGIRRCAEDTQVGEHVLPRGTWLQVDVFGMHRDAANWKDPLVFDPERFVDETEKGGRNKAWIPFGGGSRICLGMQFSLMEQKVALAMLLMAYEFSSPPDAPVNIDLAPGGLLRPNACNVV
ncbi:hypothetical protein HKX48_002012, partial [Thoreauomyces humboldtii]